MSTLLYRQSNAEITYEDAPQWIHVNWLGLQADTEMKRTWEQTLLCLIAKRAEIAMVDFTQVVGFPPGFVEWLTGNWLPRARSKGLRLFALVFPADQPEGAAVEEALGAAGVEMARVFFELSGARTWLETQIVAAKQAKALTHRLHLRPPVG